MRLPKAEQGRDAEAVWGSRQRQGTQFTCFTSTKVRIRYSVYLLTLLVGEFVAACDLRGGGLLQNADPRFGAKHYGFILGTYKKQFAFGVGAGDNTGLLLSLLALLVLCLWYKVQILTLRAASQTFLRPTPPLLTVLALLVQKYKY
jgi:hypothetical protein